MLLCNDVNTAEVLEEASSSWKLL